MKTGLSQLTSKVQVSAVNASLIFYMLKNDILCIDLCVSKPCLRDFCNFLFEPEIKFMFIPGTIAQDISCGVEREQDN